jgi:DNA-binding MarR family transcriptional regulator
MKDIDLEQVFIYLVERTERQIKRYANAALKEVGVEITPEQWAILKRIDERAVINQREIAELTFKDPASVTRALDVLEGKNLVRRKSVENDRRAYNLELTEEGLALVAHITPVAQAIRAKGLEGVSAEELQQFKAVLNKIYKNYEVP